MSARTPGDDVPFPVAIRAARASEAEALSALAFRSKAYWGYPDDFMQACREELTYTPEQLAASVGTRESASIPGRRLKLFAMALE